MSRYYKSNNSGINVGCTLSLVVSLGLLIMKWHQHSGIYSFKPLSLAKTTMMSTSFIYDSTSSTHNINSLVDNIMFHIPSKEIDDDNILNQHGITQFVSNGTRTQSNTRRTNISTVAAYTIGKNKNNSDIGGTLDNGNKYNGDKDNGDDSETGTKPRLLLETDTESGEEDEKLAKIDELVTVDWIINQINNVFGNNNTLITDINTIETNLNNNNFDSSNIASYGIPFAITLINHKVNFYHVIDCMLSSLYTSHFTDMMNDQIKNFNNDNDNGLDFDNLFLYVPRSILTQYFFYNNNINKLDDQKIKRITKTFSYVSQVFKIVITEDDDMRFTWPEDVSTIDFNDARFTDGKKECGLSGTGGWKSSEFAKSFQHFIGNKFNISDLLLTSHNDNNSNEKNNNNEENNNRENENSDNNSNNNNGKNSILLVNRGSRGLESSNFDQLCNNITSEFKDTANKITCLNDTLFMSYDIISQFKLFSKYNIIITPHGATEMNLISTQLGNTLTIELCPKYAHCPCNVYSSSNSDDYHVQYVCPRFYQYHSFDQTKIVGVATDYTNENESCEAVCNDYFENHKTRRDYYLELMNQKYIPDANPNVIIDVISNYMENNNYYSNGDIVTNVV